MENDIEAIPGYVYPFTNDLGIIEEIGGDKKFIEFTPKIDDVGDIKFKNKGFNTFKTKSLTVEKLEEESKRLSLLKLFISLDQHIAKEIEIPLKKYERKLTEQLRKKYNYEQLRKRLFEKEFMPSS